MLAPTGNRVIVERIEDTGVTKGGIHLPDNAKEKPRQGKVLAVGPGRTSDAGTLIVPFATPDRDGGYTLHVSEGSVVVFSAYAGTEVKDGEKTLLILNEDEVLAVGSP